MLNRTNRTNSANLNRLNLGTRSLDLQASANIGGQTLRIRHAHDVIMRVGMDGIPVVPTPVDPWRITGIPGSSSVVRPRPTRVAAAELEADVPSPQACRAITDGQACTRGQAQPFSPAPFQEERAKCSHKPFTGKRLHSRRTVARAAYRATPACAAVLSAKSG
jgi:hypothetical protein